MLIWPLSAVRGLAVISWKNAISRGRRQPRNIGAPSGRDAILQDESSIPGQDLTDIRPQQIASYVGERNTALPIIAGIVLIALVVGYAGYCFYATAEMIKPYKRPYEKTGIDLPRT